MAHKDAGTDRISVGRKHDHQQITSLIHMELWKEAEKPAALTLSFTFSHLAFRLFGIIFEA